VNQSDSPSADKTTHLHRLPVHYADRYRQTPFATAIPSEDGPWIWVAMPTSRNEFAFSDPLCVQHFGWGKAKREYRNVVLLAVALSRAGNLFSGLHGDRAGSVEAE